jgi:hypothetical protein
LQIIIKGINKESQNLHSCKKFKKLPNSRRHMNTVIQKNMDFFKFIDRQAIIDHHQLASFIF